MRQAFSRWAFLCLTFALPSCSAVSSNEGNEIDPNLQDVMAEIDSFSGFKYRKFAEESGWAIWYFQTDMGFKCVGTKPAEGESPAIPQAVFLRKSTTDIRLDIWTVSGIPVGRLPNFDDDLTAETAGHFRRQGDAFLKPLTLDELSKLGDQRVEVKPLWLAGSDGHHYLALNGLQKAIAFLRQCDASGPKS